MLKNPKVVLAIFFTSVLAWILIAPKEKKLVIYCTHDVVFSDRVIKRFHYETGIDVEPRYDTEATKSLGLTELIIKEAKKPRCDVFWNNEMLGTQDLQQRGLLEPYKGAGYARIPDKYKDPEGHWAGFAARLRMVVVNTRLMEATPEAIEEVLAGDLNKVAMAKPMFGTTLTHYTALWSLLGEEGLKAWHTDSRKRGLVEAPGNGPVVNLVGRGICKMGFTDTDDYFVGLANNLPLKALPARVGEKNQTICIPNTVAIIKGTKMRKEAEQFVDYVLSEPTELFLADSPAQQIPLGPRGGEVLSPELLDLIKWSEESIDLQELIDARNDVLAWLRTL